MLKFFLLFFVFLGCIHSTKASHVMGGEITWECQGGNYVFTLIFYRDCNGADVNTVSETIRVWNHPSITTLTLPFVTRIDLSPTCNQVSGSPAPYTCGSGANAGNGIGAIEKIIYRSAAIALPGTPPSEGWAFTFENFARGSNLVNLANPSNYGITIAAKMFPIAGSTSGCIDSSPIFLQDPNFVSCVGNPYQYNMNPVDIDLDSLAIGFGIPFNNFPTGMYNPPVNPIPVPYASGFSYTAPTPSAVLSAGSIPAQVDPLSGELTFLSNLQGNFAVKVMVSSFRNGLKIAEVEREMELVVTPCNSQNNAPQINAPFPGNSFTTTVNAGSTITFNLSASDLELLQDGSPQSNLLSASGLMFGNNLTSTTGCAITPCATLNTSPIITGVQGVSTTFNWQSSCDHLVDANGNGLDFVPYHFVFKVQDDFCQVPKVSYATVTINLINPGIIQAPSINCIQSNSAGDVSISWNPVTDPLGTFVEYQIYSTQNGLLASIPTIGTSSWTDPAVTQQNDYYIAVVSGCNGNATRYSDTLSNIFMDLTNPANGTAIIQWNDPSTAPTSAMGAYYHIYREYPSGTWTLIDSIPYGLNFYKDTIDICQAFLNYQIILPNQPCDFTSNISGDDFVDLLTPDIPVISAVSIDTLTDVLSITWNQNGQPDTYGYVIYTYDNNGFLYEMDTVWGLTNTSYSYNPDVSLGPLSYSVAAFDSCYTPAIPPTFQTSAKAIVNTTMFLESELFICNNEVGLSWSPYIGWTNVTYEIWGKIVGDSWQLMGTTSNTNFTVSVIGLEDYCFFIKAISPDGFYSFSTRTCLSIVAPSQPNFHYLKVATVNEKQIDLRHLIDATGGVSAISFEKKNSDGVFTELVQIPVSSNNVSYSDTDVDVGQFSYTYRARIIDSCGKPGIASNEARTILLSVQIDDVKLLSYLDWSAYAQFNGAILEYRIYRGLDGVFDTNPLAVVPSSQRSFEHDLNGLNFTGRVCFYVEAIEGDNLFDAPEISRSNEVCAVYEPIIYVPNAFIPGGVNTIFIPVITNFDPEGYVFRIFNRIGEIVFETSDPTIGWDGIVQSNGEESELGTYIYMVTMYDGNGLEINTRGFVTLIR